MKWKTLLFFMLLLSVFAYSRLFAAGHAPAGSIIVTTTDPAANPGDGDCSLIEAIDNANADADTSAGDCAPGSGADEIELGTGLTYTVIVPHNTIEGDNGLPAVVTPITVLGNGSTIEREDGAPAFRLFYVGSGGDLTLTDVTVRRGLSSDGFDGGGISNVGGALTLNNTIVRDNETTGVSDHGGGIYTYGLGTAAVTTINSSQVISNTAGGSGGGLMITTADNITVTLVVSDSLIAYNHAVDSAGGIRSTRNAGATTNVQVEVRNSDVSHNTTINAVGLVGGGGFVVNYSNVLIADTTVSHNVATTGSAHGGGLINAFSEVTILRSTIRDNLAASTSSSFPPGGGAVLNCDGHMTIANSTIAGNEATGSASGGAIMAVNCFGAMPSVVDLINSTVSGNSADVAAGAVTTVDFATGQPVIVNFANTILADNLAPDATNCVAGAGTIIASLGHNLEDVDSCNFNQPGDLVNTDPLLGPVQDNGGPTWTSALLAGSPAIDAGDDVVCAASLVDGVDQRGLPRPSGAACDSGAYELQAVAGLAATNDSPTLLGETTHLTATITAGDMVSYTWDLGDGTTGSGALVSHVYPAAGTYTTVVTATNGVNTMTAMTTVSITPPNFNIYLPIVLKP